MTAVAIDGVEALQEAVRAHPRVLPVGGGTKPALASAERDAVALDMTGLHGIVDYDPDELTVTARAGTRVATVAALLAEHGQHLPFDPPLAAAGATLGGAVACGATGPCGFHRGLRDFVIGVRFVDGAGRLLAGGGRVVKNAAGFDLPKLMAGSIGRLGVLVQLSFKVFPAPRWHATAVFEHEALADALATLARLGRGPLALEALELEPPGRLLVRLCGEPDELHARVAQVAGRAPEALLEGEPERALWRDAAELSWVAPEASLARVALVPEQVAALDARLAGLGARARYGLGANVAWVQCPPQTPPARLDALLRELGLSGMAIRGAPGTPLIGLARGGAFGERIRAVLDPDRRFPEV